MPDSPGFEDRLRSNVRDPKEPQPPRARTERRATTDKQPATLIGPLSSVLAFRAAAIGNSGTRRCRSDQALPFIITTKAAMSNSFVPVSVAAKSTGYWFPGSAWEPASSRLLASRTDAREDPRDSAFPGGSWERGSLQNGPD